MPTSTSTSTSTTVRRSPAIQEWLAGWTLVLASASGFVLTTIHVYSTGLFMAPLEAEFGWSRTQVSSGLSIVAVLGVLFAPAFGILVDRWNARRVALCGVVLYVVAIASLSFASESMAVWWALWGCLGVAALFLKPTVWSAAVGSAFSHTRGLALAVMLCGSGVGAFFVPIVTDAMIAQLGWRSAYRGLGLGFGILVMPLVWLFFFDHRTQSPRRPNGSEGLDASVDAGVESSEATVTGWTLREGLRQRQFYQLAAAAVLLTTVILGSVVHLIPLLIDQGLLREEAVARAAMIGVLSITARLVCGLLFDRLPGPPIGAASAALPGGFAAILLFLPVSAESALAAVLFLGLAVGAEYDAVIYLSTRYFGLRSFGSLFGFIASCILAGVGLGPLLAGAVFDATGSYDAFLEAIIAMSVLSVLLMLTLGPYPEHD